MKKISADASISGNASPVTVPFTAYLAAKGFLEDLLAELGDEVIEVRGRLVLAKGAPRSAAWAQNTWETPVFLPIESIGDGARKLTAIQRNWHLHSEENHPGLPHPGETPPRLRKAASFRRSRAHGPARLMDTVGAQPHPRFGPVLVAVPRRRGAVP